MIYYGDDINGVWNASLTVLPSQSSDLAFHKWRNERRALLSPRSEVIVHRKQQSLALTIARRQTDLDCPSKIAMIADRCSSFKVQERHARKTREKRWHYRKAIASLSLLHLHCIHATSIDYDKNIRKSPDSTSVTLPQNSRVFWHMRRQCVPGPTFPPPCEARASSYVGKIGTGDEASTTASPVLAGPYF